jgi:transposase
VKRVGRNLGKKYSAGRLRRFREIGKQRKAEGRPFGAPPDPRTHIEIRICELPSCRREFPFTVRAGTDPKTGRYCRQNHALQHTAILRRKCPADYELLHDLYVVQGMSTEEIAGMFGTVHKSVIKRMEDVGIPRRRVGHSRKWICTREGCNDPVFKLTHPQNGSTYGTLCEAHYREHRKWLYTSRYERVKAARGNIPDRVLDLVATGFTTSNEIAKRLDLPIKVVSTTMGRLHRSGKVEAFGTVMIRRAKASLWRIVEQKAKAA